MGAGLQLLHDFVEAFFRFLREVDTLCGEPFLHDVFEEAVVAQVNMLAVHPLQFLFVEAGGLRVDAFQRKAFHHFLDGHDFAVVTRVPAEESQVVHQRFGQVTQVAEVTHRSSTLALTELTAVLVENHRQVAPYGRLPAKGLVQEFMLRRGANPFVATEHMGRTHQVVVHDACKVVRRVTVALDKHQVVQKFILIADVTANHIIEFGDARFRNLEADDSLFASGNAGFGFFAANIAAVAVVTGHRHMGHFLFGANFLQAFFGAETIVGATRIQELLDFAVVDIKTFALEVRTAVTFATRTFVPLQAKPLEVAHQVVQGSFVIALAVGVFDTQVERTAHVLGKKVVVNSGTSTAHMQVARRTRGKTDADRTVRIAIFAHRFLFCLFRVKK